MERDIPLKTSVDVARIRRSCRLAELCLRFLKDFVKPGISTLELDHRAEEFIVDNKGEPALKGYRGFPGSICTSVNNVAAHGIPSNYLLEEGDLLGIDITVNVNGWHGDAAWSFIAGKADAQAKRILKASWRATLAGIRAARAGGRFGDIGHAIKETAKRFGCTVIEDYVGHGIGQEMHEEPLVPNFGELNTGARIVPGMVFTIEPMLNLGDAKVRVLEDGWTLVTEDNSISAQFEHTVAIFRDYTEVLTFAQGDLASCLDFPPFF